MYEELKQFWSLTTLDEAKVMIHPAIEIWDECTAAVLPYVLTPYVRDVCRFEDALEIGAGIGRLVAALSPSFDTITGIDISEKMVGYSKGYLSDVPNAKVVLCDGNSFPIPDSSVDFVYSVICLQHIPYQDMLRRYYAESMRVLRPGGLVRLQTFRGAPCARFSGVHGYFYTSLESFVRDIESSGLRVIEATCGDFHPDYLWVTAMREEERCDAA